VRSRLLFFLSPVHLFHLWIANGEASQTLQTELEAERRRANVLQSQLDVLKAERSRMETLLWEHLLPGTKSLPVDKLLKQLLKQKGLTSTGLRNARAGGSGAGEGKVGEL
jgi:hypothetical protein